MPKTCVKCAKFRKSIASSTVTNDAGSNPSILELAYMVNLEYYIDTGLYCIHEVPEDKKAIVSVDAMVDYLESRHWRIGTKTNYEGFKCTSFVNSPSKQLVIVHRGTENWQQMKADIKLALNIVDQDIIKNADWHTSHSLLNNALKEENDTFVRNDFSLTLTGHSLGGWLAQICTLLSKYPQFHMNGPRGTHYFSNGKSIDMNQSYDIHCVAFDSPGAGNILDRLDDKTKKMALIKGCESEVRHALELLDITVFLSNPNPVNMCGKHFGNVQTVDVMSVAKSDTWTGWLFEKVNPLTSHKMANILKYFVDKLK